MKTSLGFILSVFLFLNASAQQSVNEFSFLFYNVENLFDVKNDSLTNDDEFTPEGERHWTNKRLNRKLLNTSKVILNASGWSAPTIVALCEIENRYVLERLRKDTPLKAIPYKIIHKESPDFRGIDVALLYNNEQFYPVQYAYYPLKNEAGEIRNSREILYVSGIVGGIDTVHIFVNHWPSRYSGVMETRELRNDAAKLLREKIDELFKLNKRSKIVILGDFNDQPKDESMVKYLNAKLVNDTLLNSELYNLSYTWLNADLGTLKYQSQWFVFDQIIVSGGLLSSQEGVFTKPEWASISNLPYLIERDEKYGGQKLLRTYTGFKYTGGFSDHFPVSLKIKSR
jgi:endonuclease/exonuclease/phosphatase family metal-dependent hydrolase